MYDRLYGYLTENKILFKKQFGFWSGHSTNHPLLELIDQIFKCFDEKNYLKGIFADLSKAFDTVNHKINEKTMEYVLNICYGLKVICQIENNILNTKIILMNRTLQIYCN